MNRFFLLTPSAFESLADIIDNDQGFPNAQGETSLGATPPPVNEDRVLLALKIDLITPVIEAYIQENSDFTEIPEEEAMALLK